MKLQLMRSYFANGTNGVITLNGAIVCYTIELPWQENKKNVSCIPEGEYALVKRRSRRLKNHLWLKEVAGRELILIHPANNALLELEGCIAPVTKLTAPGCGDLSRPAFQKLLQLVYTALDKKEAVKLEIIKHH